MEWEVAHPGKGGPEDYMYLYLYSYRRETARQLRMHTCAADALFLCGS